MTETLDTLRLLELSEDRVRVFWAFGADHGKTDPMSASEARQMIESIQGIADSVSMKACFSITRYEV